MEEEQTEKARILKAAEERFFRYGVQRVTMEEIAADLGMSKKTLYKHFAGKAELSREVIQSIARAGEGRLNAVVTSDRPFVQKIVGIISVAARQYARLGDALKNDLSRHNPDLWKEIETFRRKAMYQNLRPLLEQGKKEGAIRPELNLDLFLLVMVSAVQGVVNPETLARQSFSANEALGGMCAILFGGILTHDSRKQMKTALTDSQKEMETTS